MAARGRGHSMARRGWEASKGAVPAAAPDGYAMSPESSRLLAELCEVPGPRLSRILLKESLGWDGEEGGAVADLKGRDPDVLLARRAIRHRELCSELANSVQHACLADRVSVTVTGFGRPRVESVDEKVEAEEWPVLTTHTLQARHAKPDDPAPTFDSPPRRRISSADSLLSPATGGKHVEAADKLLALDSAAHIESLAAVYAAFALLPFDPPVGYALQLACQSLGSDVGDIRSVGGGHVEIALVPSLLCCGAAKALFGAKTLSFFTDVAAPALSAAMLRSIGANRVMRAVAPDSAQAARAAARDAATRTASGVDIDTRERETDAQLAAAAPQRFHPEVDSTHNYRTPDLARLFNNREQARDGFLELFRSFTEWQHELDPHKIVKAKSEAKDRHQAFVSSLDRRNARWFAKFFVEQLQRLCTVASSERDVEVHKMSKDPRRIHLLQKRLSARTIDTKTPGEVRASLVSPLERRAGGSPIRPRTGDGGNVVDVDRWFSGARAFFLSFITDTDSFALSSVIAVRLASEIAAGSRAAAVGPVGEVYKQVARLRVLARFLGVLLFCPRGFQDNVEDAGKSAALDAARIEDTAAVARVRTILDFSELLAEAFRTGSLVVVVPWLCELVHMLPFDRVSSSSECYTSLVSQLQHVRMQLLRHAVAATFRDGDAMRAVTRARFGTVLQIEATLRVLRQPLLPTERPFALGEVSADGLDTVVDCVGQPFLEQCSPVASAVATMLGDPGWSHTSESGAVEMMSPPSARKIKPIPTVNKHPVAPPHLMRATSLALDREPSSAILAGHVTELETRLVDCFLEQRESTQKLVEMIVDAASTKASDDVVGDVAKSSCDTLVRQFLVDVLREYDDTAPFLELERAMKSEAGPRGPLSRALEYIASRHTELWSRLLRSAQAAAQVSAIDQATPRCLATVAQAVPLLASETDDDVMRVLLAVAKNRAKDRVARKTAALLSSTFRSTIKALLRSMRAPAVLRIVRDASLQQEKSTKPPAVLFGDPTSDSHAEASISGEKSTPRGCAMHASMARSRCLACEWTNEL